MASLDPYTIKYIDDQERHQELEAANCSGSNTWKWPVRFNPLRWRYEERRNCILRRFYIDHVTTWAGYSRIKVGYRKGKKQSTIIGYLKPDTQ
jgi:hypothetical protein